MSTNPPQPPTPPATGGQPYTDPQANADAAKRKQRWIIAGSVAVAVALIVGAYLFGKSQEAAKYDPGQPAYNAIYEKGVASGSAAGNAQGQKTGQAEGLAKGTQQGKEVGVKQGQAQGFTDGEKAGADAALGGLTGWNTNTPYVVEFQPGPNSNVPYAVQTRTLMQTGNLYKICSSGQGICVESAPSGPTG